MSSAKRLQTNEIHDSNLASNAPATLSHAVSPDITAQLRNVGMRTRKSVMEGYTTNTNGQIAASRMKAMSTGSIFQSQRDTALGVRGDHVHPGPPFDSSLKKRHRSESPIDIGTDSAQSMGAEAESMVLDARELPSDRPVKPLRKTGRALTQSQSLPAGALFARQSQSGLVHQGDFRESQEEDDWSESIVQASSGETLFEPMTLS